MQLGLRAGMVLGTALLGALLFGAGLASAGADLAGQAAPGFRAALEHWLDDDEAQALPALAGLAAAGNPSARLTLALIDKTPALQGPWLSKQSRADRIVLMRAPGGLSGTSWIDAAAEGIPQAALWRALWRVDTPMDTPLALVAAGEPRAAREALIALAARERRGIAALMDDPAYPDAMRWLGWREALGAADAAGMADTLHPGDPQRRLLGAPVADDDRADWLLSAPEAAPLAAFCAARCADELRACVLSLDDALGSAPGLLAFGSPSEALIPTADFVQSPRGQAALLRRVLLSADARGRRQLIKTAADTSACAAEALSAEAERYRYVRPNANAPLIDP